MCLLVDVAKIGIDRRRFDSSAETQRQSIVLTNGAVCFSSQSASLNVCPGAPGLDAEGSAELLINDLMLDRFSRRTALFVLIAIKLVIGTYNFVGRCLGRAYVPMPFPLGFQHL